MNDCIAFFIIFVVSGIFAYLVRPFPNEPIFIVKQKKKHIFISEDESYENCGNYYQIVRIKYFFIIPIWFKTITFKVDNNYILGSTLGCSLNVGKYNKYFPDSYAIKE